MVEILQNSNAFIYKQVIRKNVDKHFMFFSDYGLSDHNTTQIHWAASHFFLFHNFLQPIGLHILEMSFCRTFQFQLIIIFTQHVVLEQVLQAGNALDLQDRFFKVMLDAKTNIVLCSTLC